MSEAPAPRGLSNRGVDYALFGLSIGLAAFTALVASVPAIVPIVNERLDLAIETAATLAASGVAVLNLARARVARDGSALFRSSAFTVLATLNALMLGVLLFSADWAVGASLDAPGQLPIIAGIVGRGVAAILFVAAGFAAVRGIAPSVRAWTLIITPSAIVGLSLVVATQVQDRLPVLVGSSTLEMLGRNPSAILAPGAAPFLVLAQTGIGLVFLVGTALAYRSYRMSGRAGDGLMAAGLLIATFSQVHGALHPGGYTALVTTGDLLRLAFYAVVLIGVVTDRRDDLRALRRAHADVRRLAAAQLATAALDERGRLAREIHDGLAQDLWYAKLKQSRLAQLAGFGGEARQLSDEVGDAIDAALSEARHAVVTLREGAEAGPLLELITRQVEDFSDRFAVRADLTVEGSEPGIGPRAEAEVTRIVQEALTNIRKHADATVVRVRVESGDGLRLAVSDNGRGFRAESTGDGFGLESMRQRAALIGGTLRVSSEPQNGTLVELMVPNAPGDPTDGE